MAFGCKPILARDDLGDVEFILCFDENAFYQLGSAFLYIFFSTTNRSGTTMKTNSSNDVNNKQIEKKSCCYLKHVRSICPFVVLKTFAQYGFGWSVCGVQMKMVNPTTQSVVIELCNKLAITKQ